MIELALLMPDQAGNVGAILRLCACFSAPCHIIEPCGFAFSERALKRAGMDYAGEVDMHRHTDWAAFEKHGRQAKQRKILMSSKGDMPLHDFTFRTGDIVMMGSESSGAPPEIHDAADARLVIPMAPAMRSLNIAIASGIALAEALRQTKGFPETT